MKEIRDKVAVELFHWLYRDKQVRLIKKKLSLVPDPAVDYEDIIQTVCLKFLEYWETSGPKILQGYGGYEKSGPEEYFHNFLSSQLTNHLHKVYRRTELEEEFQDTIASAFGISYVRFAIENPLELMLTRYEFEERWRTLPSQLREIFALSFFEERSGKVVAETLGITENHVNVARHKIKKHMSGEQYV